MKRAMAVIVLGLFMALSGQPPAFADAYSDCVNTPLGYLNPQHCEQFRGLGAGVIVGIFVGAAVAIGCAVLCSIIANRKGRNAFGWGLFGLAVPVIALMALFSFPSLDREATALSAPTKRCRNGHPVAVGSTFCPVCGEEMVR